MGSRVLRLMFAVYAALLAHRPVAPAEHARWRGPRIPRVKPQERVRNVFERCAVAAIGHDHHMPCNLRRDQRRIATLARELAQRVANLGLFDLDRGEHR